MLPPQLVVVVLYWARPREGCGQSASRHAWLDAGMGRVTSACGIWRCAMEPTRMGRRPEAPPRKVCGHCQKALAKGGIVEVRPVELQVLNG